MRRRDFMIRFYSLVLTQFGNVRLPGWGALPIVLFLSLCLFPLKGYSQCNASGDIPFAISTDVGPQETVCVVCLGPWFRSSGVVQLNNAGGLLDCKFYAAKKTIFSPFGLWKCGVDPLTFPFSDCNDQFDSESEDFEEFCLSKGDTEVKILFVDTADQSSVTFDKPAPPCSSSVSSFLGDNFKQEKSKRDTDVFSFDGTGGDEVTVTLEPDPQAGNNGGSASLGISGDSLSEATGGTLPVEINTTLPADGEYAITVEQPRIPEDQRFRGIYLLRLESSTGIDLIEPTNNVEK